MSADTHKKHPFHMVDPSPWPFVGTLGAFIAAAGGVVYMHGGTSIAFAVGMVIILATMAGWWRDVIKESRSGDTHTDRVQQGLRWGMILFILSEVMFFAAFFWAFFHAASPLFSVTAQKVWPPEGIEAVETWGLPFLNTLILLTSGATVTGAHHAMLENRRDRLVSGLAMTVVLGVIFLGVQIHEFAEATFGFKDGIFPSTFYMATGFHGFHVFVGTLFLLVCLVRAIKGHFTPEKHLGLLAAAWYWHFVDVVWLFLFTWVYWWGSSHGAVTPPQ